MDEIMRIAYLNYQKMRLKYDSLSDVDKTLSAEMYLHEQKMIWLSLTILATHNIARNANFPPDYVFELLYGPVNEIIESLGCGTYHELMTNLIKDA